MRLWGVSCGLVDRGRRIGSLFLGGVMQLGGGWWCLGWMFWAVGVRLGLGGWWGERLELGICLVPLFFLLGKRKTGVLIFDVIFRRRIVYLRILWSGDSDTWLSKQARLYNNCWNAMRGDAASRHGYTAVSYKSTQHEIILKRLPLVVTICSRITKFGGISHIKWWLLLRWWLLDIYHTN